MARSSTMTVADEHQTRRMVGGLSLIGAGLAIFAGMAVRSDNSDATANQLADVAASRTPELISFFLLMLGAVLIIPAAMSLASLSTNRGGRLIYVGACLFTLSVITLSAGWAMSKLMLYSATESGMPAEQELAFYDQLTGSAAHAIFLPLILAFLFGPLLVAIGLRMSGVIPIWPVVLWIVGSAIFVATEGIRAGEVIGLGLSHVLALGWIGLVLIRLPDEQAVSSSEAASATRMQPQLDA